MYVDEVMKLMGQTERLLVEFTEDVVDEGPDPGMRAVLFKISPDHDGFYEMHFDLNPFSEYNHAIAEPTWLDENGEPCLKWHETSYYPEDGIWKLDIAPSEDVPFRILD